MPDIGWKVFGRRLYSDGLGATNAWETGAPFDVAM
jgi:hypothetical protein